MPERRVFNVLLVEHNPEDVPVFERALASEPPLPGTLYVVRDAMEAVEFVERKGQFTDAPIPSLVIFNSRNPTLAGSGFFEAIARLRQMISVPVFMLCASESKEEVALAYRYASAYAVIPADQQRFEWMVRRTLEYWLTQVVLPRPRSAPDSSASHAN